MIDRLCLVFVPLVAAAAAAAQQGPGGPPAKADGGGTAQRRTAGEGSLEQGRTLPGVRRAGALPAKALETRRPAVAPGPRALAQAKAALELRLYPADEAPEVAPKLPAGSLVWVLERADKGYVKVRVPGGFPGYVHARYVAEEAGGKGRVTARRVSFRHEPKTGAGTFPLALLPKGAELLLLGREGDWYRAIAPEHGIAWAKAERLATVFAGAGAPPAALLARLKDQVARAAAPFAEARQRMAAEAARRKRLAALAARLDGLERRYRTEVETKPLLDEDLASVRKELGALRREAAKVLKPDDRLALRFRAFEAELENRELVQRSARVLAEEERRAAEASAAKPPAPPALPERRRFVATGWVEYRPGLGDYAPFRLVKGGQVLFYLECPSGRYDLQDFVGREVGVRGAWSLPKGAAFRVLQAERLVILGGR